MKKEIIVYSISDSLGGTSQKLLSAVTAQYPDIIFNNSYRFPFINKEEELLDILRDAIKDDALVISTLVDGKLAAAAREFSQANGLAYLDLMHPFFEIIREKTGTSPIEVPGTLHRLDTEYFNKISDREYEFKLRTQMNDVEKSEYLPMKFLQKVSLVFSRMTDLFHQNMP